MKTHVFQAGQEAGDLGRKLGGQARAKAYNALPAPADCNHCRCCGFTTLAQHNGHLGFRAVMDNRPEALHSLREKIRRTGRPGWKMGR